MVRHGFVKHPCFWKTQLPVDYIDTSLTVNNWENVDADLSGGVPARLWYIIVEQTNNGATAETIELEITINGTAYVATFTNLASGTPGYVYVNYSLTAGDFDLVTGTSLRQVLNGALTGSEACPFTADAISLIRVRQTTAIDLTAAQIEVNIVWDKLERASSPP